MSFNPLATDSRILKLLEHLWVVILDVWDATTKAITVKITANSGPHFYDDIPSDKHGWETSLSKMPALFRFALPQVAARGMEVMNGCADSLIDAFPRCTIEQGLNWIQAE